MLRQRQLEHIGGESGGRVAVERSGTQQLHIVAVGTERIAGQFLSFDLTH